MVHFKQLNGNLFQFIFCIFISLSNELECYTEQVDGSEKVTCTANLYKKENCSEANLAKIFPNLYGKDEFPGRPQDLILQPIQRQYHSQSKIYPGFEAAIKPPKTYDIVVVRGFQLEYSDVVGGKRCIIMEIPNTNLSSILHRDLKIKVQIFPVAGSTDFTFTAFSLPTPKSDDKETLVRYGKSGNIYTVENEVAASWITTISYSINNTGKYIDFRFAPAPTKFNFTSYNIYLSKILANEGTPQEIRNTTGPIQIKEIEYSFRHLAPGRYRIEVSPHDDGSGSDCKCKNALNLCESCTKTITSVIIMPTDGSNGHSSAEPKPSSSTTTHGTTSLVSVKENSIDGNDNSLALPSALGVAAFIIVVFLVIGCYMFNRNRLRGMFPKRQRSEGQQAISNKTLAYEDPKQQKTFTVSNSGLQHCSIQNQNGAIVAVGENGHQKTMFSLPFAASRLDSGYRSQDTNSFDEQQWREVKQKYVLDKLVNENKQENIVGNFLLCEESKSLMQSEQTEEVSIAPAMTIGEGEAGTNPVIYPQHSNKNHGIAVNKYGQSTIPNIPAITETGNIPSFYINKSGGFPNNAFEMPTGDIINQEQISVDFVPPDPIVLDDDITTQYQFELMKDINKSYFKSEQKRADSDNSSGYSV